jgi:SAM-dependent methyltransferase
MSCPLCNCADAEPVVRVFDFRHQIGEPRTLVSCRECTCCYLSPFPDDPGLEYPSGYSAWGRKWRRRSLRSVIPATRRFLTGERPFDLTPPTLHLIKGLGRSGNREVLDVGAGGGRLLSFLQSLGFSTTGLDMSRQALQGLEKTGHRAIRWEDLSGLRRSFDLITSHHSLEHLPDPIDRLRLLRESLRDGGTACIVVPRIDCWGFRTYRELYNHIDGGRHLVMYSVATLCDAVWKAGFRITSVRTWATPTSIFWSWRRAAAAGRSLPYLLEQISLMACRPLASWLTRTGQGELCEVVCTPNRDGADGD